MVEWLWPIPLPLGFLDSRGHWLWEKGKEDEIQLVTLMSKILIIEISLFTELESKILFKKKRHEITSINPRTVKIRL